MHMEVLKREPQKSQGGLSPGRRSALLAPAQPACCSADFVLGWTWRERHAFECNSAPPNSAKMEGAPQGWGGSSCHGAENSCRVNPGQTPKVVVVVVSWVNSVSPEGLLEASPHQHKSRLL